MKKLLVLLVLAPIAGCVSMEEMPHGIAVRDLVAVSDLHEIDRIRVSDPLRYYYLNDYFVAVTQRDEHYLLEFDSRCRSLTQPQLSHTMIDYRRDATYIRTNWDTIRGCRIDKMYEINEALLTEVMTARGPNT